MGFTAVETSPRTMVVKWPRPAIRAPSGCSPMLPGLCGKQAPVPTSNWATAPTNCRWSGGFDSIQMVAPV